MLTPLLIELHCRICHQPYTPTRADLAAGPETYHRCPACRPAVEPDPPPKPEVLN